MIEHAAIALCSPSDQRDTVVLRSSRAFRLVVFALALVIMGNDAASPIYPVFQERFGFSTGALTLVFAAVVIGVIASLLFLGPLSDRVERGPLRDATLIGAAVMAALALASAALGQRKVSR